ncbi:MAG: hypothetical protein EXR62_02615 [Chloroflexi bacterium]|nr:hypothetical protein [Chloroflexota bacterium]
MVDSPYKGRAAYDEQDARLFFGRERELERVLASLTSTKLTVLFGAAGAGKTSLLRAGVMAEGTQQPAEYTQHAPDYAVIYFDAWEGDALAALEQAIAYTTAAATSSGGSETNVSVAQSAPSLGSDAQGKPASNGHLSAAPANLTAALQAWTDQTSGTLLIMLDHFERYFQYHDQEDGHGTFAVEFPRAVRQPGLRANFLISVREGALEDEGIFTGRIPQFFNHCMTLDHLDREAAARAIEAPVQVYNQLHTADGERVDILPSLVQQIIQQLSPAPLAAQPSRGAPSGNLAPEQILPARIQGWMVQVVMAHLWQAEWEMMALWSGGRTVGPRALRVETLNRLGQVAGILQNHLNQVMERLAPAQQVVAAALFHFLVSPSGTRAAPTVADLAEYTGFAAEDILPVLEILTAEQARIVAPIVSLPTQPGKSVYTVADDLLVGAILRWRQTYLQHCAQMAAAEQQAQARTQAAGRQGLRRWRLFRTRWSRGRLSLGLATLLLLAAITMGFLRLINEATQLSAGVVRYNTDVNTLRSQAVRLWETILSTQDEARAYRKIVLSQNLAANALSQRTKNPDLSTLLAIEAANTAPTRQAEQALRTVLLNPARVILTGHTAGVNHASFSPDGKLVVTAGLDSTARIWEAQSGKIIATLNHNDVVNEATFSPDGRFVATASNDGFVRIWEMDTGKFITERPNSDVANSVAFSPDGKTVVMASFNGLASVWEAASRNFIAELRGHTSWIFSAAFSPDGKYVVTSSRDYTARVWDVASGKSSAELKGHTAPVTGAVFSPDGRLIVTASNDGTARLWDAGSGQSVAELRGHTGPVTRALFSPDGTLIATASTDSSARIWEISTGKYVAELRGHADTINGIDFSPDGKLLVTASYDKTARVWDAATGRPFVVLEGHSGRVNSAAFSANGRLIITASSDGTARIWDLTAHLNQVVLQGQDGPVTNAAFSPDSQMIATSSIDGTSRTWQTNGLALATSHKHLSQVNNATFSPDGKLVVTASDDESALIWEASTGNPVAQLGSVPGTAGHRDAVNHAEFSPDGSFVVTASRDGTARIWDLTGKTVAELAGHTGPVSTAHFSFDGKLVVTASFDRTARVWDAHSGQIVAVLQGHTGTVVNAIFSSDGTWVVTASWDNTGRIWNSQTGESLAELRGHQGQVVSAQFSPNNQLVATASWDHTARIWDAKTGRSIMELRGHTGSINALAFSPNGRFLATASADSTARIWDIDTGESLVELRNHAGPVNQVTFSPNGNLLLTASQDQSARVYVCIVCSPVKTLVAAAQGQVRRDLTPAERERFVTLAPLQ